MTCIIQLFDPKTNEAIKTVKFDGRYIEAEKKAKELNDKLKKREKERELYWKVTEIWS